ncbi:MAG: YARHG domain-containing protein [Clostridia bacterium]
MSFAKRITATLTICLLLVTCLMGSALAEAEYQGESVHGAFAVELNGKVYAALYTGSQYNLCEVSATGGGETKVLDTAGEISDLVVSGDFIYYLRDLDRTAQMEIMKFEQKTGALTTLTTFEVGVVVDSLSWYDDVLYVLANSRLYIVDSGNGETMVMNEETLMDSYAIVNDVIFYTSATDLLSYERTVTGKPEPVKQSAGVLYSMSILGTNPEKLVAKGVTDLRAHDNYLFFHNLEDNYVMGSDTELKLEGQLYRYNIETGQMASMNLAYDWEFYPTDSGVVIYTSQDISLYPLTGGTAVKLMAPELATTVTAAGQFAYVSEFKSAKLTKLPLDGTQSVLLFDDSDVLPATEGAPEDTLLVKDATDGATDATDATDDQETVGDQTYDEDKDSTGTGSDSSYIFPNSSKKKLTRAQVEKVDKKLWGYARNEIYARHGYEFNKGKYQTYFGKKSWYKPGGFSSGSLSTIEWYNMELIKDLEKENGLLSSGDGEASTSSNSSAKNNNYVLKEARSRKLTKSYLRDKLGSKSKYALARNEILARHGYVFETAKYRKYFKNQKWYHAGGYSQSDLSRTEWYNIEQLKDLERE